VNHQVLTLATLATLALLACGAGRQPSSPTSSPTPPAPETQSDAAPQAAPQPAAAANNEFVVRESDSVKSAHGATPSKIKPTRTEAAIKFFVVDKDKGPIPGIVIALTGPDGKKYYTEETDTQGYAEVLVPVGRKYDLVYLSLGRRGVEATVQVSGEPNQTLRLTMRYKRIDSPAAGAPRVPGIVLHGVTFDTGKATLRPESFPQFDNIVEYMTHKKSSRVEISGHTDNVGNPKTNKSLSKKRAEACRDYLVSKGIARDRIEAIGYGDERPIASNADEPGRQQNRRIEATEQ
jgi:outer membrane protein OmpA-like peptidoglycan-associated protein